MKRLHTASIVATLSLLTLLTATPLTAQVGDGRRDPVTNRRISDINDEPVVLNFNNVKISDTIDFIVETTGKTVIPSANALSMKVTVVNDIPLPRDEALNRLFIAFLEYQIGVVENETIIRIDRVEDIGRSDCPVIGPDDSLLDRRDEGVIINKVFQLKYADAESVASVLEDDFIPDLYASMQVEQGSNSIVVLCSIGVGKKLEKLIIELDRARIGEIRVIELKYADAEQIAEKITTLYGPDESTGGSSSARRTNDPRFRPPTPGGGGSGSGGSQIGGVLPLRVVADTANNLVSVRGEGSLLDQIVEHVQNYWDRPFGDPMDLIRTYQIKYRDVLKIRDILSTLGGGSATTGAQPGTRVASSQQGGGAGSGTGKLTDVFQFQADEGTNELIVIAKTPGSFDFLNQLIASLDRPNPGEKPTYIELKHADAGEIAEEINVLFAKPGLRVPVQARAEGLQDFDPGELTEDTGQTAQNQQAEDASFPWQLDRPDPAIAPTSTLIGKVRVMPVYRQNAVLIIGAPQYKADIVDLIAQLDRPGRQVLISAVIVEVQSGDGLSLGLRWGRSIDALGAPRDNQFGISGDLAGTKNNILSKLFDTSVLNVNVDIAAVLDLLATNTNLRILSQPRIFTHDNEQANFFDGQEIQVRTDSQITNNGLVNQSTEFRNVGITFSVRPRITPTRDVDLEVNLVLSSLSPAATADGGLIFDRRQTRTRIIVKDRQTIIISGIMRETETEIKRKIPGLGDIPLLGALFTSVENNRSTSELIAFITPIVVENPSENDSLNEPLRDRLQELRRPLDDQRKNPGVGRIWGEDLGLGELEEGETSPSWIEDVSNGENSGTETDGPRDHTDDDASTEHEAVVNEDDSE